MTNAPQGDASSGKSTKEILAEDFANRLRGADIPNIPALTEKLAGRGEDELKSIFTAVVTAEAIQSKLRNEFENASPRKTKVNKAKDDSKKKKEKEKKRQNKEQEQEQEQENG